VVSVVFFETVALSDGVVSSARSGESVTTQDPVLLTPPPMNAG